jgi:hypothetical protein
MAGKGGYMQPSNPAPVSGPGALSQRTDGGAVEGMSAPATQGPKYMPGLGYGKGGQNMANQQSAPMAGNPVPSMPAPTPLSAPTSFPNEPITHGIDAGPGAGSSALPGLPSYGPPTASNVMRKIAQNDPTGEAEMVYRFLSDNGY